MADKTAAETSAIAKTRMRALGVAAAAADADLGVVVAARAVSPRVKAMPGGPRGAGRRTLALLEALEAGLVCLLVHRLLLRLPLALRAALAHRPRGRPPRPRGLAVTVTAALLRGHVCIARHTQEKGREPGPRARARGHAHGNRKGREEERMMPRATSDQPLPAAGTAPSAPDANSRGLNLLGLRGRRGHRRQLLRRLLLLLLVLEDTELAQRLVDAGVQGLGLLQQRHELGIVKLE
jgi:hypothetical protein